MDNARAKNKWASTQIIFSASGHKLQCTSSQDSAFTIMTIHLYAYSASYNGSLVRKFSQAFTSNTGFPSHQKPFSTRLFCYICIKQNPNILLALGLGSSFRNCVLNMMPSYCTRRQRDKLTFPECCSETLVLFFRMSQYCEFQILFDIPQATFILFFWLCTPQQLTQYEGWNEI